MKIVLDHGPRCGEIFHTERNATVDLLIALGLIQIAPEQPKAFNPAVGARPGEVVATASKFFVSFGRDSERPILTFNNGFETSYYDGPVENAKFAFGKARPVPDSVLEQYAQACAAPVAHAHPQNGTAW